MNNNQDYSNYPLLNLETLHGLKNAVGRENAQNIISEFFKLALLNIENALKSMQENDYETFAKQCHQIQSSIAYLGGERLEKICSHIEALHNNKKFSEIDNLKQNFMDCTKATIARLEDAL